MEDQRRESGRAHPNGDAVPDPQGCWEEDLDAPVPALCWGGIKSVAFTQKPQAQPLPLRCCGGKGVSQTGGSGREDLVQVPPPRPNSLFLLQPVGALPPALSEAGHQGRILERSPGLGARQSRVGLGLCPLASLPWASTLASARLHPLKWADTSHLLGFP